MPDTSISNNETAHAATSKFWKRCLLLALLLTIPIGFVIWICFFREIPLEISEETTYITEPLTTDGRVDYFRALELENYPSNMKTDDNGYRAVLRALGPVFETTVDNQMARKEQMYEKLGLDPNIEPTMSYRDPYEFLENHPGARALEVKDEYWSVTNYITHPWTLEKLPMMEPWLTQSEPVLNLVNEAVHKPTFCWPLTRIDEKEPLLLMPIPGIAFFRSIARGFYTRANYRTAHGNLDGAIDDIIACKTLGRHLGRHGMDIDVLLGTALEQMAHNAGIAESLEYQPTESQLRRLLTATQNLPPQMPFEEVTRSSRFTTLDLAQRLAHKEGKLEDILTELYADFPFSLAPKGLDKIGLQTTRILDIDWNTVTSRLNYHCDNPNILADHSFFGESQIDWVSSDMLFPTTRSEKLADYLASQFVAALPAMQEAMHRLTCIENVYQITLAMLIYEKQHGRLPPAYTVDKNGNPLHSWRVILLQYLGEDAKKLYDKIRLDEPWDSKHNRKFHDVAVSFYQCPSAQLKPGQTIYSVVVGEKTAFQAGEGKMLDQFGPDSANMLLVLESPTPTCWMNPTSDLTEATASHTALHGKDAHPGVIIVGLRSGRVCTISKGLNRSTFQQILEGKNDEWLDY